MEVEVCQILKAEGRRPKNPYRKGTYIWLIMEGALEGEFDQGKPGWEDLSSEAIAEVLGTSKYTVRYSIRAIKNETGYVVKYTMERGRPRGRKRVPAAVKGVTGKD